MSSAMPSPVVATRDVTRIYATTSGPLPAVDGMTLSVKPGEILGISGPSGSGKSTLLRLVAAIEKPDRGDVLFDGVTAWPGRSRIARTPRPGYVMAVFQDPFVSLDPRWPIWRTLIEPLTARARLGRAELRATAQRWLDEARLGHLDPTSRPCELSGGQCQRIAILRALIAQPALIVADEPTARQDVLTAAVMGDLLRQAAERGAAIVIVSHDRNWLDTLAHRAIRIPRAESESL